MRNRVNLKRILIGVNLLVMLPLVFWAGSYPSEWNQLNAPQKALAERIMTTEYVYDCCDQTISRCLQQNQCLLPTLMAQQVCWLAKQGKSEQSIRMSLLHRAQTKYGTSRSQDMDLQGVARIGDAHAPVTFLAYVCLRCPFCAVIIPQLHRCITQGALQGKVKMYIKLFPIKGHQHSIEGAMGYQAALQQHKAIPYLLKAYEEFNQFSNQTDYRNYATAIGLDMTRYDRDIQNQGLRQEIVASKREGLFLDVDATPTFFINGRPYLSEMDLFMFHSIVQEELH
jgi:hypothetical protein